MRCVAAVVTAALVSLAHAAPDTIGPDCVNSSMNDMARHGTNAAGTVVGFSSGNVTCNRGDMPMVTLVGNSVRPIVGMNMFRYSDNGAYSRMEQLGQGWGKWVAVPASGTQASCGPACIQGPAGTMGVNCADVYSSGFNSPGSMCARSKVNAAFGTFTGTRGGGTDETSINTRVQVLASDLNSQPAGTRFFYETMDFLPDDAQYVRAGQTVAVNALNNASSQEISVVSATAVPGLMGTTSVGQPAIARWATLDTDVVLVTADHDDTPNPSPAFPGTFIRCRYYVAGAATPLSNGMWRYEYAVYNLNSDRGAGSLTLTLPSSASLSDTYFRHPPSHSGEPFSNAAWTWTRNGNVLTIATDSFATNANANAIRWGTMYNFGFTTNAAPGTGSALVGLFKPGTQGAILVPSLPVPTGFLCEADVDGDAGVDINDLSTYLVRFEEGTVNADLDSDGDVSAGTPDGGVDINDLLFYLIHFEAGC